MLKAPGINRFKLNYDKLLSNFAFKINLRRYTKANVLVTKLEPAEVHSASSETGAQKGTDMVGRCKLTVSKPVLKAPMVAALETKT